MSEVNLNPVFEGFRRKMGNLVFVVSEGDTFARRYRKAAQPNTLKQQEVKASFKALFAVWKESGELHHRVWTRIARTKKRLRGHSAFIGANANAMREGTALELFREFGERRIESFAAETGAAPGEVRISFVAESLRGGKHLTLFAERLDDRTAENGFIRRDLGTGVNPGHVVSGLVSGAEYHLYAVVTDAAYPSAQTASASVAARVKAG